MNVFKITDSYMKRKQTRREVETQEQQRFAREARTQDTCEMFEMTGFNHIYHAPVTTSASYVVLVAEVLRTWCDGEGMEFVWELVDDEFLVLGFQEALPVEIIRHLLLVPSSELAQERYSFRFG